MKIRVCSKRQGGTQADPDLPVVYVGRPSMLGNPYEIGKDGTREQVINQYRAWLWHRTKTEDQAMSQELKKVLDLAKQHGGVNLQCWCAPEPCHADVLRNALLWLNHKS